MDNGSGVVVSIVDGTEAEGVGIGANVAAGFVSFSGIIGQSNGVSMAACKEGMPGGSPMRCIIWLMPSVEKILFVLLELTLKCSENVAKFG